MENVLVSNKIYFVGEILYWLLLKTMCPQTKVYVESYNAHTE